MEYGISDIKAAFEQLKDARIVLTWGEFADKIEYDRTYVSRVINGHEPLTDEFSNSVKNYVDTVKVVPLKGRQPDPKMVYKSTTSDHRAHVAPPSEKDQLLAEKDATIKRLETDIAWYRAQLEKLTGSSRKD